MLDPAPKNESQEYGRLLLSSHSPPSTVHHHQPRAILECSQSSDIARTPKVLRNHKGHMLDKLTSIFVPWMMLLYRSIRFRLTTRPSMRTKLVWFGELLTVRSHPPIEPYVRPHPVVT